MAERYFWAQITSFFKHKQNSGNKGLAEGLQLEQALGKSFQQTDGWKDTQMSGNGTQHLTISRFPEHAGQ